MKTDYARVLCFFAHPDDETLAMGGAVARFIEQGTRVRVALSNTGITSRKNTLSTERMAEDLARLRTDCALALAKLGVAPDDILLGSFSDNEIDRHTLLELIHWIEPIIDDFAPEAVFTHHRFCTNIDHQYCHEAAVVATRPGPGSAIDLYACEIPSSTGYLRPTGFEPNCYIDLEPRHIEAKIASMTSYTGEARPYPHPRSGEVLKALSQVRGSEAGFHHAEAFLAQRLLVRR